MRAAHDRRKIHARNIQIVKLKDEIKGLSLQIRNATRRAEDLTAQLSNAMEEDAHLNPCYTPADRIFLDIMQNRGRPPNDSRYSPKTRHRGWTVCHESAKAWDTVCNAVVCADKCSHSSGL
jgi:hypothetical protein